MSNRVRNILICTLFSLLIFGGLVFCILVPKESYSKSERREKEKFPDLTVASLVNGDFMEGFEKYTADHFPLRDQLRQIKSRISYFVFGQKDNNGIYLNDGFIGSIDFPYNSDSIEYASKRFEYIYQNYLKNSNVYLSVIPDKNCFMAKKSGVLYYDSNVLVDDICNKMPYATYIDIFDTLSIDDYYKTDSHWRQECITDTANKLASALGTTLDNNLTVNTEDCEFYGVYYGQAALGGKSDKISYITSPVISSLLAFDGQNNKDIPVYDTLRLSGRDPYEMFLSGALSLVTIDNKIAENDRHLVIFRDSFGSSIAPLLATGYSKVTLIDIRYISADFVSTMVDYNNADVLFLYSTSVLNNSETIK